MGREIRGRKKKVITTIDETGKPKTQIIEVGKDEKQDEEKDPIKVIKMKEIYSALETATDKAEDAADILKSIQVKNA